MELLKLKTVYGDAVYVTDEDLARFKNQIPMRIKTGERVSEYQERIRRRRGEACTVARGNLLPPHGTGELVAE